jgi:hypothetical protein
VINLSGPPDTAKRPPPFLSRLKKWHNSNGFADIRIVLRQAMQSAHSGFAAYAALFSLNEQEVPPKSTLEGGDAHCDAPSTSLLDFGRA